MKGNKKMSNVNSITLTIPNLTPSQVNAITEILAGKVAAPLADITKAKRGVSKKAPLKTVSPDEDPDFGAEALEEDDIEVEAADVDEDEEADEDEDEDDGITFDQVRAVINKYGDKKPDAMKAILTGFNLKGTKELERTKSKWQPVYDKVSAKLKLLKKAK